MHTFVNVCSCLFQININLYDAFIVKGINRWLHLIANDLLTISAFHFYLFNI